MENPTVGSKKHFNKFYLKEVLMDANSLLYILSGNKLLEKSVFLLLTRHSDTLAHSLPRRGVLKLPCVGPSGPELMLQPGGLKQGEASGGAVQSRVS